MAVNKAIVKALFIYPVKSLRGIAVNKAVLYTSGLEYDRHWMLIDPQGKFITQRQCHRMALIDCNINNDQLLLSCSGYQTLSIPIHARHDNDKIVATVWKDQCEVISAGSLAEQWLSKVLQTPARLVKMAPNFKRPQSKPESLGLKTHTYFADAAPFLICNHSSLEYTNQRLTKNAFKPVSMINFRPNIVISGPAAFTEHRIKRYQRSDYELASRYPCQRCIIPNIDIATAEKRTDRQPFKILGEINPMPDTKNLPAFGENATLSRGKQAMIQVNDELELHYEQ